MKTTLDHVRFKLMENVNKKRRININVLGTFESVIVNGKFAWLQTVGELLLEYNTQNSGQTNRLYQIQ